MVSAKAIQNFARNDDVLCPACLSCPSCSRWAALFFAGMRFMPHSGHMPGLSCTTSGCMGQVYALSVLRILFMDIFFGRECVRNDIQVATFVLPTPRLAFLCPLFILVREAAFGADEGLRRYRFIFLLHS